MITMFANHRVKTRGAAMGILLASLLLLLFFDGYQTNHFYEQSLQDDDHRQLSSDPHFWKYAYVIVTYHKAGHHLSHTLENYIQENLNQFGGNLRQNKVEPRTDFNVMAKCSELSLEPGTITVIEAPQFHCSTEQLADLLLDNPDPAHQKWGVKIIHLVRNPFTMAVSNYHYHSQDPTPEPFVHWTNPCHSLTEKHIGSGEDVVADLAAPILSQPHRKKLPIMTHGDFDAIVQDCTSLYQTKPGMKNSTYYEHLRMLDSKEGIRMSTADKFNHIALMASDLLLFNRVRRFAAKRPWKHRSLDLITMPMDDWIERPQESMHRFAEFVFSDHISIQRKNVLSSRYEGTFLRKMQSTNHITTVEHSDTDELIDYLRGDPVFGGPLSRVEALLEEMLEAERVVS